jgi:hypothetical protein
VQDYFKKIYEPLDTEIPELHQEFIRMILRAVADLIHGEGDVVYVQTEFYKKWQMFEEQGEIPQIKIGYDREAFLFAKDLFMKSDFYSDLTVANAISG